MKQVTEIPITRDINESELFKDYEQNVTGRHFNRYSGVYREVTDGTPDYDYAAYGEVELFKDGYRFEKITIIYRRLTTPLLMLK